MSANSPTKLDLIIPSFCEHDEPLLIEEIALAEHPSLVHYGKCAVIGYLRANATFVESLMVPSLPEKLHLPDGTCRLEVCFDDFCGPVPRNCTVRLYGYVQLRGPPGSPFNTARDLICALREMRDELERRNVNPEEIQEILRKERDSMKDSHTVVLNVYGCDRVSQAKELIGCNLRLKRINKILAPLIGDS